jgi:hypothetical protein
VRAVLNRFVPRRLDAFGQSSFLKASSLVCSKHTVKYGWPRAEGSLTRVLIACLKWLQATYMRFDCPVIVK